MEEVSRIEVRVVESKWSKLRNTAKQHELPQEFENLEIDLRQLGSNYNSLPVFFCSACLPIDGFHQHYQASVHCSMQCRME